MLPEKNINALKKIREIFNTNNIDWRLIGSSNLVIQGVPVEPKDIDILIDPVHIKKVQELLQSYCIDELKLKESNRFRSYFGKFNIDECEVEVMSSLEIKNDDKWFITPAIKGPAINMKVADFVIPCTPLKSEYEGYVMMGRKEKAEIIRQFLENN